MVLLHSSRGSVAIWAKEPAFLATSLFPPQTTKGDSSTSSLCFPIRFFLNYPSLYNLKVSPVIDVDSVRESRIMVLETALVLEQHLVSYANSPLIRYANLHLTRCANSVTSDLLNQESLWLKTSSLWSTKPCR